MKLENQPPEKVAVYLRAALKQHNWHYKYSDDPRAFEEGSVQEDNINNLLRIVGKKTARLVWAQVDRDIGHAYPFPEHLFQEETDVEDQVEQEIEEQIDEALEDPIDYGEPVVTIEHEGRSAELGTEEAEEIVRDVVSRAAEQQLPLEQWSEHQLATAGVELAERLTELRHMEAAETARRREYKEEHDLAIEKVNTLKGKIEEQKAALGD